MGRESKSVRAQGGFIELGRAPDSSVELSCIESGYARVAGVDEAGRGPLAGPVVAAAVILPIPCPIEGIRDSKTIDAARRENLFEQIVSSCVSYGVGFCEPDVIDEINILQATLTAMRDAVSAINPQPDILLVDGISRPPVALPQKLIKKGDGSVLSIAAASIIAKVTRDRIMCDLHKMYPEYGFLQHKGYGTKEHLDAIARIGPCPAHRKTFRGVKEYVKPL